MNNFNQNEVMLHIQQLIDKYCCSIEGFFTDSKTAASDIWKYLENEGIIVQNKNFLEMKYREQNKAA